MSFWCFFSSPIVFFAFASKLDISSLKRSVLECRKKGPFGVRKGQMVNFGPKSPKQAKMPAKLGKNNNTTVGRITGVGLNLANTYYKKGKMPKKYGSIFIFGMNLPERNHLGHKRVFRNQRLLKKYIARTCMRFRELHGRIILK